MSSTVVQAESILGGHRASGLVQGVDVPGAAYSTILPRDYYVDPMIFAKEMDRVFSRQWTFVGHQSEIPNIGDYFLRKLLNESVVIVRESVDKVSGYLNVCRHRGHALCKKDSGNARRFTCPYHHWSYGLDGSLANVPQVPDGTTFDYKDYPLWNVHVENFQGFIFACIGTERPPALSEKFSDIVADLSMLETDQLREAHREVYDINANWKTLLENYLECDHCQAGHVTLCKVMDLNAMFEANAAWQDAFFTGKMPLKSGMKTASMNGELVSVPLGPFKDKADLETGFGVGFGIFPALTRVIVQVDHVVAHVLRPIAVDRVEWETRWYVRGDAVEGKDYDLSKLIEIWQVTNSEDKAFCESAYRGVRSKRFTPGPLSNTRESTVRAALQGYLDLMKD
jgi:phenylpropionate dioxygenase-like ring-hydroxylating dioxygenase large terminal subunit